VHVSLSFSVCVTGSDQGWAAHRRTVCHGIDYVKCVLAQRFSGGEREREREREQREAEARAAEQVKFDRIEALAASLHKSFATFLITGSISTLRRVFVVVLVLLRLAIAECILGRNYRVQPNETLGAIKNAHTYALARARAR